MWWPFGGKEDPLQGLDPTLRDYLQKQAPQTYHPTSTKDASGQPSSTNAAPEPPRSYREWLGLASTSTAPSTQRDRNAVTAQPHDAPAVPKESLFPDGRYAHLWKTYRPLAEAEAAGKTDQERLNDIVGGFKERRDNIKQVALENCSEEQWNVHDCFRSGKWSDRLTMCKVENRSLERCVKMQTKFLRALGYLSPYQRSDEESEKMQMHAYTLYHRMLDQEKLQQEAAANGEPIPEFPPLVREQRDGQLHPEFADDEIRPRQGRNTFDTLPQDVKAKLETGRLKDLQGQELELEKQALNQEIVLIQALTSQLDGVWRQQHQERLDRKEAGQERLSDKIMRAFDFRNYEKEPDMGKSDPPPSSAPPSKSTPTT